MFSPCLLRAVLAPVPREHCAYLWYASSFDKTQVFSLLGIQTAWPHTCKVESFVLFFLFLLLLVFFFIPKYQHFHITWDPQEARITLLIPSLVLIYWFRKFVKRLNIMKRMLSSKWNKREKRNIINSRFVTASVAFHCHPESSQFANTSSILSILRLYFMCNLIWDCVISLKSQ